MELSQLEMKIYKVQSNKMKPYKMNMMKNRQRILNHLYENIYMINQQLSLNLNLKIKFI